MRQARTGSARRCRSVIETHLSLLDGLSAELPEDPVLDGKVAFPHGAPVVAAAPRPSAGAPAGSEAGVVVDAEGAAHGLFHVRVGAHSAFPPASGSRGA